MPLVEPFLTVFPGNPTFPSLSGPGLLQIGNCMALLSTITSVSTITPGWDKMVPAALGQIHKVVLKERHGKPRSLSIYIDKGSRAYRVKAVDHSRSKSIVTQSIGIQCPDEINDGKEAFNHLSKLHPEKYMLFLSYQERMEDDDWWPGDNNWGKASKPKVQKSYPFETMGHCFRWYCSNDVGQSQTQLINFAPDCWKLLSMSVPGYEKLGYLPAQDLRPQMMVELTKSWIEADRSINTLRGVYAVLSACLGYGLANPEDTGIRRGLLWGQGGKTDTVVNPINTERRRIDSLIEDQKREDINSKPQPFTQEEAASLCEVFVKDEVLKPYWPLFFIIISTGCRPNEALALRWDHVLGLWKDHQLGYHVDPAKDFVLTGQPVLFQWAVPSKEVSGRTRKHVNPDLRFKQVKNGMEHQPLLNNHIPGFENAFERAILERLPRNRDCMKSLEWRKGLVFQGPRQSAVVDTRAPYDWHNFRRYMKRACLLSGVRYRKPYNARHTYVSHMFRIGRHSSADVASWIGDVESTMRSKYSGVITLPKPSAESVPRSMDQMISEMSAEELMEMQQKIMAAAIKQNQS